MTTSAFRLDFDWEYFMKFKMVHCNINVSNLEKSIAFYEEALHMREVNKKTGDGFTLAFLEDEHKTFQLELTELADHPQKYDLGENESHIAFQTDDYDAAYAHHKEMNCICFENTKMGLYFIEDPDGYWLEIVPIR